MKRKIIITILCLTMGLSIVACGKQETTSTTETIPTTVESTQTETSENTTEPTEEIKETETENENTEKVETTEITDNIVYPDVNPEDVDPKTTKMDAETATALAQQEGKEIDEKYGSEEAWATYAISQGADNVLGWCWVYYTGQGAGSEESYAVYMKEDSPRKGEVFHLGDYLPGGVLFTGYNSKEMGIADVRVGQRQVENGELDGVTFDEDGTVHIVID